MQIGARYPCLICLSPDSFEARLDKKGRLYLTCVQGCGAKIFLRSRVTLGLDRLWGPVVMALRNNDGAAARLLLKEAVQKKVDKENERYGPIRTAPPTGV